jgi:hypothetical protein
MAKKELFSNMFLKTTAAEESPVQAGWKNQF